MAGASADARDGSEGRTTMGWLRRTALALLGRYGARLRFPQLLLIAGGAFLLDLVLPDGLPFLDELMLGIATLILALWRKPTP